MAVELWDEQGELKYEALDPSETEPDHDHFAARQALTRGRAWPAETRRMNTSDWVAVDGGALWGIKFKIGLDSGRARVHRIFRDSVLLWVPSSKSADMQAVARSGQPVFVLALIFTGTAMDLPLGNFFVTRKEAGCWRLLAEDPFPCPGGAALLPPLSPLVEGGGAGSVGRCLDEEGGVEEDEGGPPRRRPRIFHEAPPPPGERPQSLRFLAGRDSFDSLLECIHRQAFGLMRLQYHVARHQFDLTAVMPGPRRHYTPDGLLYVRLGSPGARPRLVHVEIKPGPLSVAEDELCWALCRAQDQSVLCVIGGVVEARAEAEERERSFVEMTLYDSTGPLAEPMYYPRVVWRWGSPDAEPYLSPAAPADPRKRLLEQQRLRSVYAAATFEARRLAAPALARLQQGRG